VLCFHLLVLCFFTGCVADIIIILQVCLSNGILVLNSFLLSIAFLSKRGPMEVILSTNDFEILLCPRIVSF
jgi:hypothetical protein